MTFTDIVLQINGEITQRRQFSWTELQRNEGYRRVVQGLGMLFGREDFPITPRETKLSCPVGYCQWL